MMTLIIALIFGMLLASSLIFLGFDLVSKQTNSVLYQKVKIVSVLYDTYKAYKEKKSSKFFNIFLGKIKLPDEERNLVPVTKDEYIDSSKKFRVSLENYLQAIKDAQSIEILDAQPNEIEQMKIQTLGILGDLEKIREYIRDLHIEGVKATSISYRTKDNLRRINEEESNAFRAINMLSPKEDEGNNDQEQRGNQRPRRQ